MQIYFSAFVDLQRRLLTVDFNEQINIKNYF